MIEAESQLLPVFEGATLTGVVTVDGILERVRSCLDAATVGEAASRDLVTLESVATLGKALHERR